MISAIRPKFTLFALITLLALPLNLFGQIFEKDGVKIEVTYPKVDYTLPLGTKTLDIKSIEFMITNLTNKNIIINQKSIPGQNVAKSPSVIRWYAIEGFNTFMMYATVFEGLVCFSPNWALTVFDSHNLAKLVWIIQAAAVNMVGAKIFEYYYVSDFLKSEKELYIPDKENSYFFGLYKKKYAWQKTIEPYQSDTITILLDSNRNKFTFDVYKSAENLQPERIRFAIELKDDVIK